MTIIRARDLGTGPHRKWGSALNGTHAGVIPPLERIGRTRKLGGRGCPVCKETDFHCDCEVTQ
jgi:hypothetical protein